MIYLMNLGNNNMAGDIVYVDEQNIPSEYLNWIEIPESALIKQSYAVNGYLYDTERQIFIPPQPYQSWTFDDSLNKWISPIPYPDNLNQYVWNEENQAWSLLEENDNG